jgi:RNA polymerase sigma-70 factor (ECF subfamily)
MSMPHAWDWNQARTYCLQEARRCTSSYADAEDVAQSAILRAWRGQGSLRDSSARSDWLRRITRNEAARLYGRIAADPRAILPELAGSADLAAEAGMRVDVERALASLEGSERALLMLRYGGDLTHASAAVLLGMPVGTVKVRLHRLRGRLAGMLGASYRH